MPSNYRIIALFCLLLLVGHDAIAAKDSAYFRHLTFRETPYSPYRGIHPIDKKTAQTTAHYRFDYDKQGRVTAIAHMIGDQIINDNGNWDTFIWFAPKVIITYQGDQEIHQYHNSRDERITAHGDVYQANYQTNPQGQRITLTFTNADNQPSENAWGIHRYQWQHTGERQIIEKRFDLAGQQKSIRPEFHFFETHMTFNHRGLIEVMKNHGTEGKPSNNDSGAGIDRIFYDLAGNFQRWHVYDKDGKPVNGNRPMVHIGEHLYDSQGNKIGMRGFDTQGKPIPFSWGDFEIRNHFDHHGNQTGSQILNRQGQQTRRITVEYQQGGLRRDWIKTYDANDQLSTSPLLGGAAALKYQYQGASLTPSGHIAHDANLKPIEPKQ